MPQVKPIPDGYAAVTPYLTVKGAAQAIEFYKKAFGAEEVMRMPMANGRIAHAEINIGGSFVMLSDESQEWKSFSPQSERRLGCCQSAGVLPDVSNCAARGRGLP
jgi:PhnB protein